MSTHPKRLGKYELQAPLGRGGMGEVWKAFDTQLQRYVAIKLLHADLQNDSSFIARFQREAQLIASLHHSNIVQLYDFQVAQPSTAEDALCYMVMHYVEGQTLAQYIRSTSRVGKYPSAAEMVQLFASLSLAVDYAHHKSMIHRDIKPSNILLDKSNATRNPMGEPILTDFGIAKLLGGSNNTLIGSWLGTPNYTSPEQARGDVANERSDIYSLGVILYEMCTGLLPFQGENAAVVLMQHINAIPTLPHSINPNVPPALTMVIMRSLAKNPTVRFPSASALTVALAEALNRPIPEELRATMVSSHTNGELNYQVSAPPTAALEVSPISPSLKSASKSASSSQGIENLSDPRHTPLVDSSWKPSPIPPSITPIPGTTNYVTVQGYVRGESLQERLSRLNQPLEERDVLVFASQVLDALEDMAQQTPPLMHGNIRPATILIGNKDGRAHLVDRLDAAQVNQIPVTPPGYAPLELLQGSGDARADLYALAATMHHLLTNRNPCNQPPFLYPLARMFNPRLSLEVERLLAYALTNDISQRYQSATEMKRDIDDLLQRHYGRAGATGRSGSGQPVSMAAAVGHPVPAMSGASRQLTAVQVVSPQRQSMQHAKGRRWWSIGLVAVLLMLILAGLMFTPLAFRQLGSQPKTISTGSTLPLSGIGVSKAPDGEPIGISDGTFAFDTKRVDGALKMQAAQQLQANDRGSADSLWQQAIAGDSSDAEALIYMEDRRILDAGDPYITIVVGTTLTGDPNSITVGREATQAAYVAQREYNMASKLPNGVKVRLLIANSGGVSTYTIAVAQQVVQLAHADKTVVAVMGWTSTATTLNAIGVLSPAKIPMVANSGADVLTGRSRYFFRVVLPASSQGLVGALYAEQTLHARTAVVFEDIKNNYALGLANGFTKRFMSDGMTVLTTESYTVGKAAVLPSLLQNALSKHPDVIYFAGYPGDAGVLLAHLQPTDPPLLGGSSLYQLGGYSAAARAGLSHLRFTAYSYPDEWDVLGLAAKKPAFFADYQAAFDPNGQHSGSPYGYTRPDGTTMELYDAISILLTGCSMALTRKSTIGGSDLQQALTEITGQKALQGITSQISLGSDSNPIERAIVMICVYKGGFFKMDGIYGKFLVGEAQRAQFFEPSSCS